jgi:uncharacterized membrane protein
MALVSMLGPVVSVPSDPEATVLILLRWLHILAGIVWVGMLYFFNLVNVPFMKEIDAATKGKVVPTLLPRALWWFRWGSVATVLLGIAYWMHLASTDAHNAQTSPGGSFGWFFLIWTAVWVVIFVLICVLKLDKPWLLCVLIGAVVFGACYLYLILNSHGWESNHTLGIGLGGGIGWVMMLNVWGVIWRFNKKIIHWTRDSAANGTAIPEPAKALARQAFLTSRTNFYLSFPMLFLMAAAAHYPMFGR